MMVCGKCGSINQDNNEKCYFCHGSLKDDMIKKTNGLLQSQEKNDYYNCFKEWCVENNTTMNDRIKKFIVNKEYRDD